MADDRETTNPEEMHHPHVHEEGKVLSWSDDSEHDQNDTGHYELMADAIRELVIEKGVVTAEEIREHLDFMDSRGVHLDVAHLHRQGAEHFGDPLQVLLPCAGLASCSSASGCQVGAAAG